MDLCRTGRVMVARILARTLARTTVFGLFSLLCILPVSRPLAEPSPASPEPGSSVAAPPRDIARERSEEIERAIKLEKVAPAFLGADGELGFEGINDFARGSGIRFVVLLKDPGLELVNLGNWEGGAIWSTYATVVPDAVISYRAPGEKLASLKAAPHKWTIRDTAGNPGLPPEGTVLYEDGTKSPLPEPPAGNAGWIVLGYKGLLFTPPSQANRPPNVLWVLPKKEGGIDLVHSGPLHRGVFATIQADRRIMFGPGADGLAWPKGEQGGWWQYIDYDTVRPMMLPPGFTASISGRSSPEAILCFKNGEPSCGTEGKVYRMSPDNIENKPGKQ